MRIKKREFSISILPQKLPRKAGRFPFSFKSKVLIHIFFFKFKNVLSDNFIVSICYAYNLEYIMLYCTLHFTCLPIAAFNIYPKSELMYNNFGRFKILKKTMKVVTNFSDEHKVMSNTKRTFFFWDVHRVYASRNCVTLNCNF